MTSWIWGRILIKPLHFSSKTRSQSPAEGIFQKGPLSELESLLDQGQGHTECKV